MAKISDRDVILTFGQLVSLRADGWISTETGEDVVTALALAMDTIDRGTTGEIEITQPTTDHRAIMDVVVTRDGLVTYALRAKCECGNWQTLCHPDA